MPEESSALVPPPAESLPTRQRATAAETRLTAAEWGLLVRSDADAVQRHARFRYHHRSARPAVDARFFGINTEQFGYTVAAYAFGAGLSSLFGAPFFLDRFDRKRALVVLFGRLYTSARSELRLCN